MKSDLILFTSGSTDEPKEVRHSNEAVQTMLTRSIAELGLTSNDVVLNVFPSNVIAYYSITAMPALEVGATLVSMNFDPYQYIKAFNKYKPTIIALIPRMVEILQHTKGYAELDMSCVRYMIMGSQNIPLEMIEELRSKGVKTIGNWYGSTETPPPVFVAKNGLVFDFNARQGYNVEFADDGECIVNGWPTQDVFTTDGKYSHRKNASNAQRPTWKTNL